jgi:hypothetical protein
MRINLRGRNVGMAENSLHRAQVRSILDHMRSAGVPQHVRTGVTSRRATRFADQLPDPLPRQAPPPVPKNKRGELLFLASTSLPFFRYRCNACWAGTPSGTMRSLSPLPRTRCIPFPASGLRDAHRPLQKRARRRHRASSSMAVDRAPARAAHCADFTQRPFRLTASSPPAWLRLHRGSAPSAAPSTVSANRC